MPPRKPRLTDALAGAGRSYDVGYGKPPVATRFAKGTSGNPKGRPPGSRNRRPSRNEQLLEERLKSIVVEEAYRTIRINEGENQINVPMARAVMRSIANNAARGNTRAQRLFAELVATTEAARVSSNTALLEAAIDYKQNWTAELERRQNLGIDAPDPLPHPDHVHIDARTGHVQITGPMTPEEKREWDFFLPMKDECEERAAKLRRQIADCEDPDTLAKLQGDLTLANRLLDRLRPLFPEPDPWNTMLQVRPKDNEG